MADIASLGIKIDTSDVQKAEVALDKLGATGAKTEEAAKSIGKSLSGAASDAKALSAAADGSASALNKLAASGKSSASSSAEMASALREQIALFGKSTDDILRYKAAQLGAQKTVEPLIAELRKLQDAQDAVNRTMMQEASIAAAAAQSKSALSAAQYGLIEGLREQVAMFGKSNLELTEFEAKMLGVSDAANPLIRNLRELKAAQEAAEHSAREEASAQQSAALAKQSTAISQQAFIASLREQVAIQGKSRAEILEYKAAQLGVGAQSAQYVQQIRAFELANSGASTSLNKVGLSAKQTAAALRGVPAQFTDIATSLAGGQNPLTVMLQQGGQLKDMFGGIGPAARAMGGYVAGLVNPFTVAAAAAAVLALAYKQGSDEATAYTKAVILTGNAAGTSADSLGSLAKAVGDSTTTTGAAADALNQLASTGKIAEEQFSSLAAAAVNFNEATGKAVSETVAEFAKLADDPVRASESLNQQYNYLTAAVYEQIQALQEQGDNAGAAALAEESYAQALNVRANDIKESLGSIESAWNAVGLGARQAWDKMLGIGREQTLDDKITELKGRLAEINNTGSSGPTGRARFQMGAGRGGDAAGVAQELLTTELQKAQNDAEAARAAFLAKTNKEGIAALRELDAQRESSATKEEKHAKELEDYAKRKAAILAANPLSTQFANGQDAKDIAAIDAKYAEKEVKARKPAAEKATPVYRDDAATKMLQSLREQGAALNEQLTTTGKLTGAQREQAKFTQLVADLKTKSLLTVDQKSLLNSEEEIKAQLAKNAALDIELNKKQQAYELEELRIKILRETGQLRAANDAQSDLDYAKQTAKYEADGNAEALEKLKILQQIRRERIASKEKDGTTEGVSAAPDSKGSNPVVTGAAGELDRLKKDQRALRKWRDTELDLQKGFLEARAINEEEYQKRVRNVNEQTQTHLAQIERTKNQTILASSSDFFGNMAALSQSGNAKLGAVGKAAAIAQATISGFTAVQNALAVPPYPLGIALAVSAGVMSAANIASIAGVGFKTGGYTGDGGTSDVAGVVHGKEFVFDAAATSRIGVSNLESMRSGKVVNIGTPMAASQSAPAASSQQSNVTNINLSLPGITSKNEAREASGSIARKVSGAVGRSGRYT